MPQPTVPPTRSFPPPSPPFLPSTQIFLNADALAEKARQTQTRGIDFAEWTEPVTPRPPSTTTTVFHLPAHAHAQSRQPAQQPQLFILHSFLVATSGGHPSTARSQNDSTPPQHPHSRAAESTTHASPSPPPAAKSHPRAHTTRLIPGQDRADDTAASRIPSADATAAPAHQVSDSYVYGASDDDGDGISLVQHRESHEETLHITLDEILDAMDLSELERLSGATTKASQSDCEGEGGERDYCVAGMYDYCAHASLHLQNAEACE